MRKGPPKIAERVLHRNRLPKNCKASGLLLSHLPVKQPPRSSKTPAGPARPYTCLTKEKKEGRKGGGRKKGKKGGKQQRERQRWS